MRIDLLGIPIDAVSKESLSDVIKGFYSLEEHRQIVLLDFHEFMKFRRNAEGKKMLQEAALVIPTSSLLVFAARFLKKEVPPLRYPYPFVIRLLEILEKNNKSLYLLGSTMKGVRATEKMIRTTFPGIQIVGRYSAHQLGEREDDVITAIKKASPTLLLTGKNLKGKQLWISRNRRNFTSGLGIWEKHCFDVFSERKIKPNDSRTAHFFKGFLNTLIRPWRIFRIFRYAFFFLLLLAERIRQ